MKPLARLCGAVVVTGVCMTAATARADPASEAELQYLLGTELYKQRKFQEALQHFIASNRLVPNANVVFNIALTYGLLNRPADAFNWYETFLRFPNVDEAARSRARAELAALAQRVAVIAVTTSPPEAELFVDRVDLGSLGSSPRKLAVAPGAHKVIARLSGHHDAEAEVVANLGATAALELSLSALVGTLAVETNVPAAVRREDTNEALGETPLRLTLPAGEYRLIISAEGYVDQQRVAVLRADAETRVQVKLEQAASRVAALTVTGTPQGARVLLAGRDLGPVPLTTNGLTPGVFELEVVSPGHEAFRHTLVLEAGGATRVAVRLVGPNDLRWRWLKWVGYGAGAVGFGAGLVVGGVAISKRNGFWEAPNRRAADLVWALNPVADALWISGLVVAAATALLDLVIVPTPHTAGTVEVVR